jgi:predicted nucleic acid-binding protein
VLELLLGTAAGLRIARRIAPARETLHAPHLVDLEVAHVLRRFEREGDIDAARGSQALEALRNLDLARYARDVHLPRIWQLRAAVTAYDAVYLALAEALAAPLLTLDGRLARSHGHRARIELVAPDRTRPRPAARRDS